MNDWHDSAPCSGKLELFFPEPGLTLRDRQAYDDAVTEAVTICSTCPFVTPCQEYALRVGARDGIWAGQHLDEGTVSSARRRLHAGETVELACCCQVCGETFSTTRRVDRPAGRMPSLCSEACRRAGRCTATRMYRLRRKAS